jgi:hypothetical protein
MRVDTRLGSLMAYVACVCVCLRVEGNCNAPVQINNVMGFDFIFCRWTFVVYALDHAK